MATFCGVCINSGCQNSQMKIPFRLSADFFDEIHNKKAPVYTEAFKFLSLPYELIYRKGQNFLANRLRYQNQALSYRLPQNGWWTSLLLV